MGIKNIVGELQVNGSPVVTEESIKDLDIGSSDFSGSYKDLTDVPTKISEFINDSNFITKSDIPKASGTVAGITIVYPAASCTTFSSDSGTVTPLAVQKGAKMFSITRPTSTTNKAITRYSNTTGDVQDSKIIIEDVTNSKDSSKKAQVIAIPAEGNKKMVYGYCTDQVDGTSFIGGVFDKSATSYPYNAGLAIGGTSGNLLWKGDRVATASDLAGMAKSSDIEQINGEIVLLQNNKADLSEGEIFIAGGGTTDGDANTSAWTGSSSKIRSYFDGLTIKYKIGVVGESTTTLNINGLGARTIYRFSTTKLTTQFPVGSIIRLTYHESLNNGCWMCNDYDANTNTYQRVYETSTNKEYAITTRYNTTDGSSYYAEYGRYTNGVTINPSTNTVTATTFKGNLTGTATKATQDANGNTITSTYETKADATAKSNQLSAKIDEMTPIRGEDYWTEEDVESIIGEANILIADEMAKKDQLIPEFANSTEECTDTNKLYVLPDNEIYGYVRKGAENWTNAVPTSIEFDGSIFGYADGHYVSEGTAKSSTSGTVCTGCIPYSKVNGRYPTIYIKGLPWKAISHSRVQFLTREFTVQWGVDNGENKFNINGTNTYLETNFTIEKKVGNTWVATTPADTGTYWRLVPNDTFISIADAKAAVSANTAIQYVRMSLYGNGADLIISLDNPIETTHDYGWHSTGHKFVSIPTNDPIVQEIIYEEVASIDIMPEFANSLEELEQLGDTSKLYVLPDNYIYAYMNSQYTGEIKDRITDGFLNNTRLSTSGDETRDAAGFVTTPYFDISKYPDGFTIKLSGIEWWDGDDTANVDGYAYHLSPNGTYSFVTNYTRDYDMMANGGYKISCDATTKEVTITTDWSFKKFYNKVRFSGKGTSANAVVEVIYNGNTTGEMWINTGNKFVSVPTEDPIVQEIIKDNIADLRVKMEFVDSTDYMTDTSKVYVLDNPDDVNNGYIYTYRNTKTIVQNWKNILPDALAWPDGTGTNYAPGLYHGIYVTTTEGGTSPDNRCTITSKIPYTKDSHPDLYIKGINWDSSSSHSRVGTWMEGVSNAAKATINIANMPSMGLTVETLGTNYYKLKCIDPYATNLFYYSGGSVVGVTHIVLSFANLDGNEEIIVSYEPIEDTVVDGWQWARTGLQFIPADYEDRIIELEERTSTLESIIDDISIDGSGVPVYIADEAQRVAEIVQSKRTVGSLTFTAMSDAHVEVNTTNASIQNNMVACRDAGLGLAELQKYLKLDLTAMLGDYTWADNAETIAQVKKDLTYVKKCMTNGMKGLPNIWCTGNHDINYGTNSDKRMTEDDLYAYLIGNNTDTIQDGDNIGRNYGYVDFENQRIRCIYLNTIDSLDYPDNTGVADDAEEVTAIQAQWLVDVGLNFSNKSEPTKWGTVFFSHHCLSLYPAVTKILTAYKNGTNGSVNITTNGVTTTVNYSFASTNRGEIICAVHGHNHNFNLRKISDEAYYSITEAKAWLWSIGVPNVDTIRSNEVATYKDANGQPSAYALAFGQFTDETKTTPLTYPKTKGTAASTSFCVITIDRKNRKVHAVTYGAGAVDTDREIDY